MKGESANFGESKFVAHPAEKPVQRDEKDRVREDVMETYFTLSS